MAPAELFFSLLEDGYPLEGLKTIDLEGFDWSSRHESGQTLLVVRIANAMIQPQERFEDALETIEWLIRSGASTEQKCTGGQWNWLVYPRWARKTSSPGAVQGSKCDILRGSCAKDAGQSERLETRRGFPGEGYGALCSCLQLERCWAQGVHPRGHCRVVGKVVGSEGVA